MKKKLLHILLVIFTFLIVFSMSACDAAGKGDADISVYLEEGNKYLKEGNYSKSIDAFEKAAKINPSSVEAYRGIIAACTEEETKNKDVDNSKKILKTYEKLYNTRGCTAQELYALGMLYKENGETAKCRDLLEQAFKLDGSANILTELNNIVVDAKLDNNDIENTVKKLCSFLDKDDMESALTLLLDDSWHNVMLSSLKSGYRRYVYSDKIKIETGFDANGVQYNKIWYTKSENSASDTVVYIRTTPTGIFFVNTFLKDGKYSGEYKSCMCNSVSGEIYTDEGSLKDNLLCGNIKVSICNAAVGTKPIEMWKSMDSLEKTEYTGIFDEQGHTSAAQQSNITSAGGVIYAYNAQGTRYLYLYNLTSPASSSYVFNAQSFSIDYFPEW